MESRKFNRREKNNKPVSHESTEKDIEKPAHSVSYDCNPDQEVVDLNSVKVSPKAGVRMQRFDCTGKQLFSGDCIKHKWRLAVVLNEYETQGLNVFLDEGDFSTVENSTDSKFICHWKGLKTDINSSDFDLTINAALDTMGFGKNKE